MPMTQTISTTSGLGGETYEDALFAVTPLNWSARFRFERCLLTREEATEYHLDLEYVRGVPNKVTCRPFRLDGITNLETGEISMRSGTPPQSTGGNGMVGDNCGNVSVQKTADTHAIQDDLAFAEAERAIVSAAIAWGDRGFPHAWWMPGKFRKAVEHLRRLRRRRAAQRPG